MNGSDLPNGWAVQELDSLRAKGEHTFVGGPFGSDLTSKDYVQEPGVPVIRGTNLGGNESRFIDDGFVYVSARKADALRRNMAFPGDVVFTQRGTLGQVAVIPRAARFDRYVISQSQMKLSPDPAKIESRFLYYYFRSPRILDQLLRQTQATGVPHINLGILKRFPVVVPPLPAQRRIAEVLDRAEALRAKRRAALAQLDTLTQSIFLDLFGDPSHGSNEWSSVMLGDVAEIITGYAFRSQEYQGPANGIRLCRGANVMPGRLDWSDLACWPADRTESLDDFNLVPGDIVLAMDRPWISEGFKLSEVRASDCPALLVQRVARLRGKTGVPNVFLLHTLGQPAFVRHCRPTETTIPHISPKEIRSFTFLFPPLALQRDFARRIAAVDKLKSAHRASLAKLDALFAALQHRAFRGEL